MVAIALVGEGLAPAGEPGDVGIRVGSGSRSLHLVLGGARGAPETRRAQLAGGGVAAAAQSALVEEHKASGFVAQALQRHGIQGAAVAP